MELVGNLKTQEQNNIIVKRFKISFVSVNYILVTSIVLTLYILCQNTPLITGSHNHHGDENIADSTAAFKAKLCSIY